jgi:hypothetical protein
VACCDRDLLKWRTKKFITIPRGIWDDIIKDWQGYKEILNWAGSLVTPLPFALEEVKETVERMEQSPDPRIARLAPYWMVQDYRNRVCVYLRFLSVTDFTLFCTHNVSHVLCMLDCIVCRAPRGILLTIRFSVCCIGKAFLTWNAEPA